MRRDPLEWIKDEIVLSDGRRVGGAIENDEWIVEDLLAPIFVDEEGKPRFSLCYLELPRGHWKTGGAAAVAIAEAALFESTDVVVAAADADQAGIVLDNIAGYLKRNPGLARSVKQRRGEYVVSARDSRIRVIASDAPTAWGLGGTHKRFRVICDELTNWKSEDLWLALSSATGKVADTQTVVISNAGYTMSGWQWQVRETAATAPWGYMLTVDGPIASWIDDKWIAMMAQLLPGPAFERVILNRWTTEGGDFITRPQWRTCVVPGLRPRSWQPDYGTAYAGLDLGLTHDRTALAIVHLEGQAIVLDELQTWEGTRDEPVSIPAVERAVLAAAGRYRPLRIVADTWQLQGSMQRLKALEIKPHPFGAAQLARLSSVLYEAISGAHLRVFDDRDLEDELLSLQVVETSSGWKFDHRAGGYNDRAVALAMAVSEAMRRRQAGHERVFTRPEPDLTLTAGLGWREF